MIRAIKDGLTIGLLLVLVCLGLSLPQRIDVLLRNTETQLFWQNVSLIKTEGRIASAFEFAAVQLELTRTDLNAATIELNKQVALTNNVLIDRTQDVADSVANAEGDLNLVAGRTAVIEKQLSDILKPLAECIHVDPMTGVKTGNGACFESRWDAGSKAAIDTLGSMDKTSRVIAEVAPKLADSAVKNADSFQVVTKETGGVATDIHTITSQIARPRSFFGRLWEGLKLLAYPASRLL